MKSYNSFKGTKPSRYAASLRAFACVAFLALVGTPSFIAATFDDGSPPLNETTFSIGVFKIVVEPAFAGPLAGYPGFRAATRELTSPVLYDSNTQVGRSAAHVHGDAASVGGVPVGAAPPTTVKLSDYSNPPRLVPAPFQAPGNVREVFTEVRRMVLVVSGQPTEQCSNRVLTAGSPTHGVPPAPALAIGTPLVSAGSLVTPFLNTCLGQVQSTVPGGGPAQDFTPPARSFFDIFAEIDVPSVGGVWPGALFTNSQPIVVQDPALTAFPPRATYIHGVSIAVPVVFKSAVPAVGAAAGQLFGYLTLAGHGVFTNCPNDSDTLTFLDQVLGPNGTKPGAPVPQPVPVDTCPPANSSYDSPAGTPPVGFTVPGLGTILVRNFRHGNLTNPPIVLPPLNGSATWQGIGTRLSAQVSTDGGQTWPTYSGSGNVAVVIRHSSDSGNTRFFDTEMVQLSISGGTFPAGAMLRESPTRQSTGQTAYITGPGTGFEVGSFFDVNLELSLDGGATWIPADGPTRVELNIINVVTAIPTVSEWGLIVLTLLMLVTATLAIRRLRSRPAGATPA